MFSKTDSREKDKIIELEKKTYALKMFYQKKIPEAAKKADPHESWSTLEI
jgi:hypothetical protein